MSANGYEEIIFNGQNTMLRNVAEDLKLPLTRILMHIQLANAQSHTADTKFIEASAEGAIKLIDSYILSTQVYAGQQQLLLQPVSVGALLNDTLHYLSKVAALYDCELEVVMPKKLGLAMANPAALQAAFLSLGYGLLNTLHKKPRRKHTIVYTARHNHGRIETGILSRDIHISTTELRLARGLTGSARKPFTSLKAGSNAGILVADVLLGAMNSEMQAVRRRQGGGLIVNLLPSKQLALL